MKTYRQFREDVQFANDNMLLEAKGFGEIAKKRRNKRAKSKYLSPRAAKLRALKDRTGGANELWSGLENFDVFA